jgi:sodium transport system permease protein
MLPPPTDPFAQDAARSGPLIRPRPSGPMAHLRSLLEVTRKELRVSLRDKQTALMTLVLPIVMYPLMFWLMIQGVLVAQGHSEATEVRVGVAALEVPSEVLEIFPTEIDPEDFKVLVTDYRAEWLDVEAARTWLQAEDEAPDAVLVLAHEDHPATVYFDSTTSSSNVAKERIDERLEQLSFDLREAAAVDLGLNPDSLDPLSIDSINLAPPKDQGAFLLSRLLPMMLVVMCVMGAFFPAVDLTAGERERGTNETTLLLPVPRRTVLQGKVLAVGILAMVAIFLNLIAIGMSAENLLATLAAGMDTQIELPIFALFAIAPLAMLFALFTAAVLTAVAGHAMTFQSAQALMGPVQLVFIGPAMISMLPGLELTPTLALVPILNVSLALEALLMGKDIALEYTITAGALLVQAWLAIEVSVRLLGRESLATRTAGPSPKKKRTLFGKAR